MKQSELSGNFGKEVIFNKTEKGILTGISINQNDGKIIAVIKDATDTDRYVKLEGVDLVK